MSIGICAKAKKNIEYQDWICYTYAVEDLNAHPFQKGDMHLQDGSFAIRKSIFKGSQDIKNRSKQDSYFSEIETYLSNGDIVILYPCKNEKQNYYAKWLLYKIFIVLHKDNNLPESVGYFV